ncbi:unnamed protein product [Cuscuta campestris]|uniref:DUF7054 domain-containing protein n=1 Tax=Cuscuta campestris TaxID=132261 RepID=A0A484NF60_9ASTE|nr:unnamed protein product [Cuscuta campestris]
MTFLLTACGLAVRGEIVDAPAASRGGIWGLHKLTKLLLIVNVQNGLGPIRVVLSPENTFGDLIKEAIEC